jgi:hypothetical protein
MPSSNVPPVSSAANETPRARVKRVLAFYEGRAATDAIPIRLGDLREMQGNIERAAAARRPATIREIADAKHRLTECVKGGEVSRIVAMLTGEQVRQLAAGVSADRDARLRGIRVVA